jgi:hypothetical protein
VLNYKKQYLLTITGGSQPSVNWLDADSRAQATASYVWNEEAGRSRLVLASWQLGSTNPQAITRQTSGTFTTPPITMNAPQTVTFRSVTQYFVEAATPIGELTGRGWYDAGSGATIGLRSTEVGFGNQTRALFRRWTGSATAETPAITITVNEPKRISAEWARQYLLSVRSDYGTKQDESWVGQGERTIIALDPVVDQGNLTRRVFSGWSGDAQSANQRLEVLMDRPKTVRAEWKTQFFVEAATPIGELTGRGWYDAGSGATIGLRSTEVGFGNQTRALFRRWTGSATAETPAITITVNEPKTVRAEWKTQYFVTVKSLYGSPAGQGWFDKGFRNAISVEPIVELGNGTQRVLKAWIGAEGRPPLFDVEVIRPLSFEADWKTQFLLRVDSDFPQATSRGGWFDKDSIATVSVATPLLEHGNNTRHAFAGWLGNTKETSFAIRMDSPKLTRANWKTQYPVTINSQYGQVIGDGWHDSGSTVQIGLSPTAVGVLVLQTFDGWTGDLNSNSPDSRVLVDSPKVITAKWRTDYTQLVVVLAVAGAVGGFVIRRRGYLRRKRAGTTSAPTLFEGRASTIPVLAHTPAPQEPEPAPAPERVLCKQCGTVNTAGSKFCKSCGTAIQDGARRS